VEILKKSYSGLNLLQKKLTGLTEDYKGFIDYFFTSRKYMTLKLPYYMYLRGIIFIDDLRENYKEQVPPSLNIATLIYILYNDFMKQVKRGAATNAEIASYLMKGKEKYFHSPKVEKRVIKALTKHLLELETIEEEIEEPTSDEKFAYLDIRIRDSEILRCEVLIHELEPYFKEIDLSVEEVMTIIYLDFVTTVKNEGNSTKIQKSILAHLINKE
jgi:hypothetical protein